jgi:Tol biopolymer transport system component
MAGSKLRRVETATGAIKEICDTGQFLRGASWNANSMIIFGVAGRDIERVSADGGTPTRVTVFDRDRDLGHNFPQFLPDGKHFLYLIQGVQEATTGIYIGSLDAAPEKQGRTQIMATASAALYAQVPVGSGGHLLFLRGKTLFAQPFDPDRLTLGGAPHAIAENVGARGYHAEFSVSQTGLLAFSTAGNLYSSVAIVSRDGTTMNTLGKPDSYEIARLSPDGHSVAVVIRSSGVNRIWVMDTARGVPTLFTNDSWISTFPTWSPDGKEIAFASNRGGAYRMYRKPATGDGPEHLIQATETTQIPVAWFIDGKAILYVDRNERNDYSLRLLPLASGSTPILMASRVIPGAALSPSGDWVAFCSDESGTQEVYVRATPGGSGIGLPTRVSSAGGAQPAWSTDGNELFFNSLDDRLMSVAVKYPSGRFEAGQPKELFPLGGSSSFPGATYWEPIGNGQRFIVLRSAAVIGRDNRVNVVINWQLGKNQ